MKLYSINTKNKFINNLLTKGIKIKGEKILSNSMKELQKSSKKRTKQIIQLSLILASPIFKISTISNKKRKKKKPKIIPIFIFNRKNRISLAIKFILSEAKKKDPNSFYKKLKEKILALSQSNNNNIDLKKVNKQALLNKNLLKYYRWH